MALCKTSCSALCTRTTCRQFAVGCALRHSLPHSREITTVFNCHPHQGGSEQAGITLGLLVKNMTFSSGGLCCLCCITTVLFIYFSGLCRIVRQWRVTGKSGGRRAAKGRGSDSNPGRWGCELMWRPVATTSNFVNIQTAMINSWKPQLLREELASASVLMC